MRAAVEFLRSGSLRSLRVNNKMITREQLANLIERRCAPDWQPIATVPTWPCCLVWDPYFGMKVARFDPLKSVWLSDGPYDFEVGGKEIELQPTHWMPLPKPPTDAQ